MFFQIISKMHQIEGNGSPQLDRIRYYYKYEITRTGQKYWDQPQSRCTNEANNFNMTSCIAEYIATEMGCSMNFQGIVPENKKPCNTTAQLITFAEVSKVLESLGATGLLNMTNCTSSCEKTKYDLHIDSVDSKKLHNAQHSDVEATFTIKETTYIQEEQYVITDFTSFLAEVGGFMGLVLGSSLLGMYDELHGLLYKFNCRALLR